MNLLTIYVPIYNRSRFLRLMLEAFLPDSDLFGGKVCLTISDNCSEEDLEGICREYEAKGLTVNYHRNATNIGGDPNIQQGYFPADSRYVWVLGSDDIPMPGVVRQCVDILEKEAPGILWLDLTKDSRQLERTSDADRFCRNMNIWTTLISACIIGTEWIDREELAPYCQTNFIQMAVFYSAAFKSRHCLTLHQRWLVPDNDAINNGGYNVFGVFVQQFLDILDSFTRPGFLSKKTYNRVRLMMFKKRIVYYVIEYLILRQHNNYGLEDGWKTVKQYYGHLPYMWFYIAIRLTMQKRYRQAFLRKIMHRP